jgi:NAD(P)-dependent dehydrogenase (short-subunit alcohol dehydrogenase family)
MNGERAMQGKVVVITGAGGGLGQAAARRFAADGARLVLSDLRDDRAGPLAGELGGRFVAADVTREEQVAALVDAAVATFGRIDVMLNNAGQVGAVGPIATTDGARWSRTIAVLLDSVFYGMKHAARAMIATGEGGVILSTTSVAGIAALGPHAYTAAKHGVVGLTLSVAAELAAHRIRVNAVAPGNVPTGMTAAVYGGEDRMRAAAIARNPLGTVVEADEIAAAFAYLAGPSGRNVTGQVLTVDAGLAACPLPASYYDREPAYVGAAE